jgi:hypothetical protein
MTRKLRRKKRRLSRATGNTALRRGVGVALSQRTLKLHTAIHTERFVFVVDVDVDRVQMHEGIGKRRLRVSKTQLNQQTEGYVTNAV